MLAGFLVTAPPGSRLRFGRLETSRKQITGPQQRRANRSMRLTVIQHPELSGAARQASQSIPMLEYSSDQTKRSALRTLGHIKSVPVSHHLRVASDPLMQ